MVDNADKSDDVAVMGIATKTTDTCDAEGITYTELDADRRCLDLNICNSEQNWKPANAYQWTKAFLTDSDEFMSVDGSSTPVTFTLGPGAGEIFYIKFLSFVIYDSSAMGYLDFGALAGLTNGIDFKQKLNSVTTTIFNFKNNSEIVSGFSEFPFVGVQGGIINDKNFFNGNFDFDPPLTLTGDDGDELQMVVNDDLTSVTRITALCKYWEVP